MKNDRQQRLDEKLQRKFHRVQKAEDGSSSRTANPNPDIDLSEFSSSINELQQQGSEKYQQNEDNDPPQASNTDFDGLA